MPAPPPRSPSPIDIAILLALVVGCTVAVRVAGGPVVVGSWIIAAGAAVTCGLVFGLPALAFTLERGWATPTTMLTLGAIGGALPLPLLAASGVFGLYLRSGGWDRAFWALERGMPIPGVGVIFWSRFLRLETQAILIGVTCAVMFWLLVVRSTPESRGRDALTALFALGALMTAAALLR